MTRKDNEQVKEPARTEDNICIFCGKELSENEIDMEAGISHHKNCPAL